MTGRSVLGGALALASLLAAAPARAQVVSHEETRENYATEQRFAFELKFGPYVPDVDSEFGGGQHPYKDYFGTSKHLMSQVEFDWQFFHLFGSAALGVGAGWFSESARAFLADGTGRAADKTTLEVVPTSASLVYRFDVLAERTKVPLVPYGKVGLDYAIWTIRDGNGNVAKDLNGGNPARGGTMGWHAAVGLSIMLDVFDPGAARSLDNETGVNHTHLFAELGRWDLSGLGKSGKLHLGDTTWSVGLMFEF